MKIDLEKNVLCLDETEELPIMVNTIENEDGSLTPTPVCEMHIGIVNGKKCLLITPEVIALN